MQDSNGIHTSTYDPLNRTESVTNPAGQRITYSYGAAGQRAAMIEPDGGRFTYAFDGAGRMQHQMNPQGDRTTYSYDLAGRRTLQQLANGTRASLTYDAADRLTFLGNLKTDDSVISSFDYGHDNVGNRTSVLEASGDRVTWTYDASYQLTNERRSGVNAYNTTFVYDPVGNRLVRNADGNSTTYMYDPANQLQTSEDSTGVTTYTFDPNGNQQVVQTPSGALTTNTWDYENRLTLVELPTAARVTMAYNANTRRVMKAHETAVTHFAWDEVNDTVLLEADASGNTTAAYTHEPAPFGGLISDRRGNQSRYYHFDALGSTRHLTDSTAQVTDAYLYDAFGNTLQSSGPSVVPYHFVGRSGYYHDQELADYYVRARHYCPVLARWLSQDPIRFSSDRHLYEYAGNSPIIRSDPSGMDFKELEDKSLKAACEGSCTVKEMSRADWATQSGYAVVTCRAGHYAMEWNEQNKEVINILRWLEADECRLSVGIKEHHEEHHMVQAKQVCGADFCAGKNPSGDDKILLVIPPSEKCLHIMECFASANHMKYLLDRGLGATDKKCCGKARYMAEIELGNLRIHCPPDLAKQPELFDPKRFQKLQSCCPIGQPPPVPKE